MNLHGCNASAASLRRLAAVCVCVVLGAGVPRGAAQPSDQQATSNEGRVHYLQGKAFYDAKRYTEALKEFRLAYQANPYPELLINIGQAQRGAGDLRGALHTFQRFLRGSPGHALAVEIADVANELRDRINAEDEARQNSQERARRAMQLADTKGRSLRWTGAIVCGVFRCGLWFRRLLRTESSPTR